MVSTSDSPAPDLTFRYIKSGIASFIAAAAILLLWPDSLTSRWSSGALAAVHLFAIGGLTPAMVGALFQFVPVASGISLPPWGKFEYAVMAALPVGACCLGAGFLASHRWSLLAGAALAIAALTLVGTRLGVALWREREAATIVRGLRASLVGLAGALALAALLSYSLAVRQQQPPAELVNWHAMWAIAGWAGTLIASVASVIVPMFNVTDGYPNAWHQVVRAIPWCLAAGTASFALDVQLPADIARIAMALTAGAFGLLTIRLLHRSRRRHRDAFRLGWTLIGVAAALSGVLAMPAILSDDPRWTTAFGVCALAGLAGITVTTMIYRIVPFLIWLHWQRINKARARLPLMHEIIAGRPQNLQLALQVFGGLTLVLAVFVPALQPAGALMLLASQCMLYVLVSRATGHYVHTREQLLALPPRSAGPRD